MSNRLLILFLFAASTLVTPSYALQSDQRLTWQKDLLGSLARLNGGLCAISKVRQTIETLTFLLEDVEDEYSLEIVGRKIEELNTVVEGMARGEMRIEPMSMFMMSGLVSSFKKYFNIEGAFLTVFLVVLCYKIRSGMKDFATKKHIDRCDELTVRALSEEKKWTDLKKSCKAAKRNICLRWLGKKKGDVNKAYDKLRKKIESERKENEKIETKLEKHLEEKKYVKKKVRRSFPYYEYLVSRHEYKAGEVAEMLEGIELPFAEMKREWGLLKATFEGKRGKYGSKEAYKTLEELIEQLNEKIDGIELPDIKQIHRTFMAHFNDLSALQQD